MILTLEVIGPHTGYIGSVTRKVFDASGGTIGRLPDNHWMLPDPHVSGRHAVIRYTNGTFYIEDTSTNGVCINTSQNRLTRGQPYPLKSGDRILIDVYEIQASIAPDAGDAASKPFVVNDPFADPASPLLLPPRVPQAPSYGGVMPGEEVDPLSLLGLEPQRVKVPGLPTADGLAGNSVLSEHYQAPAPAPVGSPGVAQPRGAVIPHDYDPLVTDDRSLTPPRERPRPATLTPPPPVRARAIDARGDDVGGVSEKPAGSPTSPPGADIDLAAMLAAAGVDPGAVTPELARNFGRILRVVVSGVMDVLQARQETKEEFRMGMTRFKRADNNPLKFSANVDDALHNLLVKRNAAYLGPVDAFEDAFEDLRNHQMATLAGMRMAFDAMLAQFDPARLQAEFDHAVKTTSVLSVFARFRYWDLYRERFQDMVRDQEATFRRLFGDRFAEAYEEQLQRLKAQGRSHER